MLARYDLTPARLAFLVALLVFFGAFLIYPLFYVLVNAFYVDGRFTLAFFWVLVSDPAQWGVVLNSINLGLAVTAATTVLSLPMAFAMVRYEFPGRNILNGLILVPMVLPPFVGAVGMRQMFARFGSVNLLLMDIGLIEQPIDWFGGGGMLGVVVMEVLHLYPIMYLNVAAALANVDPSLEEAARNVGASGFRLFRKVLFPLFLPGYFAGAIIVFIWAFTDLGTPLIFEYRQVVPVQIFNMLSDIHENPMGYVLVVLMVVMSAGFFYLSKSLLGGKKFEMMVRGHVASAVKTASRRMTVLIYAGMLLLTFVALIPHISVVLTSLTDRWFMTVLPEAFSGKYYGMVFDHQLTSTSIRNSLFLSSLSTVVDIVVGISVAYLLARTRIPGKNLLDTLTMLPLAVPGIIVAFGYVAGFSGTFLDVRVNPVPLLVFGYAIRRLPYMVRSAYAGFQQTSVTLEEAAQNVGATPAVTLRRITLPLVFANLVAGGILCFSFAMLEVSDSLILAVEERYYPITKAIYALLARPDGPYIASALGVLGMLLLMASLFLAGKFLGRRMGELFRA
ncbi:MAG: iron ABC transporter permease [bacterium]|nr:iron ABC transporter permease [bacterium]